VGIQSGGAAVVLEKSNVNSIYAQDGRNTYVAEARFINELHQVVATAAEFMFSKQRSSSLAGQTRLRG